MEAHIRLDAALDGRRRSHVPAGLGYRGHLRRVAVGRRQGRCFRFEDAAHLLHRLEEAIAAGRRHVPGQDIAIEQVPARARLDARSDFGPRVQQSLGLQHLDGLADGRPAHAQPLAPLGLVREQGARREVAAQDARADLLGGGEMPALAVAFVFGDDQARLPLLLGLAERLHAIERDSDQDAATEERTLPEGADAQQRQAVVDDLNKGSADDTADRGSAATHQIGAADDCCRDYPQLVGLAEILGDAAEPTCQEHTRDAGRERREQIDAELDAAYGNAGQPGSLFVAPNGEDVATPLCPAQTKAGDYRQQDERDDGVGDTQGRAAAEREQLILVRTELIDHLVVRPDLTLAAGDRQHSERNDEGLYADISNEEPVDESNC